MHSHWDRKLGDWLKILGATLFTLALVALFLGAIFGFVSLISAAWHTSG
jgi:hypothetical protein